MRLFGLVCVLVLQGCGVLMGSPYLREEESVLATRTGLIEPVGFSYAADVTATFSPAEVSAVAIVKLTRIKHCRTYSESQVEVQAVEGRMLSPRGLVIDAGVLAAGLVGSLIVAPPAGKGAVILGAAIPLAIDGIAKIDQNERPVETRVEKHDLGAPVPCETAPAPPVPLWFTGEKFQSGNEDVYALPVSEAYLMANGTTDAVRLELRLDADGGHTIAARATLDAAYRRYAIARDEAVRYGNPLRVAQFLVDYPASSVGPRLRQGMLRMLPAAQNADELQAVLSIDGLDPEVRRAVRARFTALRTGHLLDVLPTLLADAVAAERSANTFLLNGFRDEGQSRLAEKDRLLAEACRAFSELALRDGRPRKELISLVQEGMAADGAVAAVWLAACQ